MTDIRLRLTDLLQLTEAGKQLTEQTGWCAPPNTQLVKFWRRRGGECSRKPFHLSANSKRMKLHWACDHQTWMTAAQKSSGTWPCVVQSADGGAAVWHGRHESWKPSRTMPTVQYCDSLSISTHISDHVVLTKQRRNVTHQWSKGEGGASETLIYMFKKTRSL